MNKWEHEDKLKVVQLREEGKTYQYIADLFGRSTSSVSKAYQSIVNPKKKRKKKLWTDEDNQKLLELIEEGKTFEEVAKMYDRSPLTIKNKWHVLNRAKKEPEKKEMGINISHMKKRVQVGQKIKMPYTMSAKNYKKVFKAGVVVKKYSHHAMIKFEDGEMESYQYFDLLGVQS